MHMVAMIQPGRPGWIIGTAARKQHHMAGNLCRTGCSAYLLNQMQRQVYPGSYTGTGIDAAILDKQTVAKHQRVAITLL